ncbi:hypothetical protein [Hyphomonas sp.]|uniref:hypothetical protein n=1 Tax=Hyphomonas sp. TaxID=87 RepID=UPI0025C0CD53|nr:hypothetical protein [Hyphomonas sp.]
MGNDVEVLLLANPQRFMEVVQDDDAESRVRSLNTLDDMMTCEALRHGLYNDRANLPALADFYRQAFLLAPVERRKQIYSHVTMIVQQIGGWTVGAITPFMLLDPDLAIVSTATVDYASVGSLLDEDPMTRPKDAVMMVERGIPENPAALLGGLLALGDPRVCKLVKPFRTLLSADQVATITKCQSGFTAKCVVEFYLEWLEELVDQRDHDAEATYGNVVAGLYRLARERRIPFIADGFRPFPVPGDGEEGWPDLRRLDPSVFATSIERRLLAIERREAVPRVLPHAIRAFELIPLSRNDEVAAVQ